MSSDRQDYLKDCMTREGNIPIPIPEQADGLKPQHPPDPGLK
jgi:hypothetical protein